MKHFPLATSMPRAQSVFASVAKSQAISLQYIQNDLSKMRSRISEIDDLTIRAVPMVPPNLSAILSNLESHLHSLTSTYRSIDYFKYSSRADRLSDSVENLSQKVQSHIAADPHFNPSKAYANTFVEDVITRLLSGTRRRISSFHRVLNDRLETIFHPIRSSSVFLTEIHKLETPRRTVFIEKTRFPDSAANLAILFVH
jgi:hypothetical protein